jgi:hypothetical protein
MSKNSMLVLIYHRTFDLIVVTETQANCENAKRLPSKTCYGPIQCEGLQARNHGKDLGASPVVTGLSI